MQITSSEIFLVGLFCPSGEKPRPARMRAALAGALSASMAFNSWQISANLLDPEPSVGPSYLMNFIQRKPLSRLCSNCD